MILLRNLRVGLDQTDDLRRLCAAQLKCDPQQLSACRIVRRSIDARKRSDVHFVCTVAVTAKNETTLVRRCKNAEIFAEPTQTPLIPLRDRAKPSPVVVGSGPAGLFAALTLARFGYNPILIERGKSVDERKKSVSRFWETHELDTDCNVQFGEGGAGTFSDGKLNTGTKDVRIRTVLETFVEFGAPESILYDAQPHIGTDLLTDVIRNMRQEIIRLGGSVLFEHRLTDIVFDGDVKGIACATLEGEKRIECDGLILAIGHSARDTFERLKELGVPMEPKPFSVGVRIEHLQSDIDRARYGDFAGHKALGAANYKLAAHVGGRGVYTFCMCPGGVVVAASSEKGGVVTNGMSYHARDGVNANSALLVGVEPRDFGSDDVLAGVEFQRKIERAAYNVTNSYRAVCQRVGDFMSDKASSGCGEVKPTYTAGVEYGSVTACLPENVCLTLKAGITAFGKQIAGFDNPDALLTGPETRSSSPVRILRDAQHRSPMGFYPCGEGAGYAGGIVSAAVDGIRCAESLLLHE